MSICIHGKDMKDGCDTCFEQEQDHRKGAIERRAVMQSEFEGRISAVCWSHDYKVVDDTIFIQRIKNLSNDHNLAMQKELELMFEEMKK